MIGVLTSKLESFREKHDTLSRAYMSALKELDELHIECLRKATDIDTAKNTLSNELR